MSADVVGDAGAAFEHTPCGEIDENHRTRLDAGPLNERAAVVAQFVSERLRVTNAEIIAPLAVAI